jgi:hypothetical protein
MGDTAGPDRSSVEVKALLRKLDPKTGSSHKDRVRLLNRFRNYAEGGGGGKGDVSFVLVIVFINGALMYFMCAVFQARASCLAGALICYGIVAVFLAPFLMPITCIDNQSTNQPTRPFMSGNDARILRR